jgi:ATP-binding cassette subfamily C (CFTR/MRP) protein 1
VLTSLANVPLAFLLPVPLPVSYILEALVLALTPWLTYLTHTRTRTSSTPLLLFWPIFFAGIFAWGRTLLETGLGNLRPVFAIKCATAGLGLVAFILEYLGPETAADLRPASEHSRAESDVRSFPVVSEPKLTYIDC